MASIDWNKAKPRAPAQPGGKLENEYGHGSGDRNTRTDERDWKVFKDGREQKKHVDAGREPSGNPRRHQ